MNRRKFLNSLVGGIAASAAVRTFPFRVFSFPSEIHVTQAFRVPPNWMMYESLDTVLPLFHKGDLINMDSEVMEVTGVAFSGRFPTLTVRRGLPCK